MYRVLERPGGYELFQRIIGARRARRRFVDEVLRPFPGMRVLDIGCGAGTLLDLLPEDVAYTGFDMNPVYIESAKRAYGDRARFFCARVGDDSVDPGEGAYDLVVAKSVLHHLDDDGVRTLLETAKRALCAGGVFASIDPVRHDGQALVARMLIALDRGARVRTGERYAALASETFEEIESRLATDLLSVPYSHWIMRATRQ